MERTTGSPNRTAATVRKPTRGALLLGLIPFVAICFSVSLWDRVNPMVAGLPFNLFWLVLWIVLTPACMWGAYRCGEGRVAKGEGEGGARAQSE